VINPRREKSGVYKVILKNNQGQDERDINVNIMGKSGVYKGILRNNQGKDERDINVNIMGKSGVY
jgi:hypothetical protein